jgi:hypothetical protein
LYIALGSGPARAQSPDALYAARAEVANAVRAAAIWAEASRAAPGDFDAAWKLARVCYYLGGHGAERERRGYLEQGIAAGERARGLAPTRPEGHFWVAANMGALAESYGLRAGLKYRRPIREALETVLRLDPSFMNGSADRALGRYYFKVPGLFGGSKARAERHLRASLTYDPHSTISLYFLAEVLVDQKRTAEARVSAEWAPEYREYKQKAAALLATLR